MQNFLVNFQVEWRSVSFGPTSWWASVCFYIKRHAQYFSDWQTWSELAIANINWKATRSSLTAITPKIHVIPSSGNRTRMFRNEDLPAHNNINGHRAARRPHKLCSICFHSFGALVRDVGPRLFIGSFHNKPMYPKTLSIDIFVNLQPVGWNLKGGLFDPRIECTGAVGSGLDPFDILPMGSC